MRFRYQSIDKKYIQIHVKFEGRLFIKFGRNKRYKKNGTFFPMLLTIHPTFPPDA
jgi:hypothetical protein